MPTSNTPAAPGLHGHFVADRLPDWLKHSTPSDMRRWRERLRPAHVDAQGPAPWFGQAAPQERQQLLDVQQRERVSIQALAKALKGLQGLAEFAEPLLKRHLKSKWGVEWDVNTTELVQIHRESVLFGSLLKTKPHRQSLLQAALQNFAADCEFEPGSALAPKDAFGLELVPGQAGAAPRFRYRYERTLEIDAEQFAALCHDIDLGGQYQVHLQEVFEHEPQRDTVRRLSIQATRDHLRVAVQVAWMKGEISLAARDMFTGLLEGQRAPLLYGKPAIAQSLSMFQTPLDSVLVFSADRVSSDHLEPIIAYMPGAPLYPLREYASVAAFKDDLRINLRDPAYRTLFHDYAPRHEQADFFYRLDQALHQQVEDASGAWSAQPNPQANLHVRDQAIAGDLFDYLQTRQLDRIKANARDLAVPSAEVDEAAHRQRLMYWESIGFNALNAAAFFVPGLGEVMALVAGTQLIEEVIYGAHAWEAGELDEALAHFEAVALNIALAAGLGVAGHSGAPLQASERVDGLLRVTLPGGEQRLWQPDLKPYAHDVEIEGISPDREGIYHSGGKRYITIDGSTCEVFQGADGGWSIRHPDDPKAYQPALRHNGEGAWQMVGEHPLQWDSAQLLRRSGAGAEGLPEEVLEQARQISGISDEVLRRMHLDHLPVPALLADTLRRFQTDRKVSRLIAHLNDGHSQSPDLDLGAPLGVELARWPERVIEVYDALDLHREPVRYGADLWPHGRTIRVSKQQLYANQLAEVVLEDLSEAEIDDLLGSSVERDKRVEVLRALISQRAVERRAGIFKSFYEHGQPLRSSAQERLIKDFPSLTDVAAAEIEAGAERIEREQLHVAGGRVPLRLAEEARVYQRQLVLNRALQGLFETNLASLDSDRLALGFLAHLPGWTDEVRIEIRDNALSGRLLASVGNSEGELKSLVRQGDRYTVYDAGHGELSKGAEIFTSLLKALPDSERRALGFDIYAVQPLRAAVCRLALADRAGAAHMLGQQPIRPWFRSPLRLADGRMGYPLSGRQVGFFAANRRISELYPAMGYLERERLRARLAMEPGGLGTALERLEDEYQALKAALLEWQAGSRNNLIERHSRVNIRKRLKDAWRRVGGLEGQSLTFSARDLQGLPLLTARFDYIESLTLQAEGELPIGFLNCFPKLKRLSIISNGLTAIAPEVSALSELEVLNLSENQLHSTDTMLEALTPLIRLRSLILRGNRLLTIPDTALSMLPALTQLDLSNNQLNFNSASLQILTRLPLRELNLVNNQMVLDEAGAQAFSGFLRLEQLRLRGNPLGRAPALGTLGLLQHLDLSSCGLGTWPEGLSTLMNQRQYQLRSVELEYNQIDQLPPLVDMAFGRGLLEQRQGLRGANLPELRLHMSYNPLNAEGLMRLRRVGVAAVPSEGEGHLLEPHEPTWPRGTTPTQQRLSANLLDVAQNAPITQMLGRLTLSWDYQNFMGNVQRRVWKMLETAEQHEQLRQQLVSIANDFPPGCGDAGSDAFLAMETAVEVFVLSMAAATDRARSTALFQLYKQLFRRKAVEHIADRLAAYREERLSALREQADLPALDPLDDIDDDTLRHGVDGIEIRMALRRNLAAQLDYPEPSAGMLYERLANVSEQTTRRVAAKVREQDTVELRQAWMVQDFNWQRYLEQRYPAQFAHNLSIWADGQEYLDFCVSDNAERPDRIDSSVLAFLRSALDQEPLDADGSLRKLEINDGVYDRASRAINTARDSAESALRLSLTRAEEGR